MKMSRHAFLLAYLLVCFLRVGAEGSKEVLNNNATAYGALMLTGLFNGPVSNFRYNNAEGYQMRVRIANADERIYMGFEVHRNDWVQVRNYASTAAVETDVWVRIRRASDNVIVFAATRLQTGEPGWINNVTQALAGPATVVGAAGYNALVYAPTVAGDYIIEFARNNDPGNPSNTVRSARFWDVTVHNHTVPGTDGIRLGRLHSQAWPFNTIGNGTAYHFQGSLFPYTADSVVTRIDFTAFDAFGFTVTCNEFGVRSDLAFNLNRRSEYHNTLLAAGVDPGAPAYRIFLNEPDVLEFPSGQVGSLEDVVVEPCSNSSYCLNVNVSNNGSINVIVEFPNGSVREFVQSVSTGVNCIDWDGRDGNGDLVPNGTVLDITVGYLTGLTHLPLRDVEDSGGISVTLVRPSTNTNGDPLDPPLLYWDDTYITTGTALDDLVQLDGVLGPAHAFSDRGDNADQEWLNTWWYTNQDQEQIVFEVDSAEWQVTGVINVSDNCEIGSSLNMFARFRNDRFDLNDITADFTTNYPAYITLVNRDTLVVDDTTYINADYAVMTEVFSQPPPINVTWTVQASNPDFAACNNENSFTCDFVVLPLHALQFSGRLIGNDAHLEWGAESEWNVASYTLVRATDDNSTHFKPVAQIPATGMNTYRHSERNLAAGIYYYRLQYTDGSGVVSYSSNTIQLTVEEGASSMHYAPSSQRLLFSNNTQTAWIYDILGKEVRRCTHCAEIDMASLPAAAYVVKLRDTKGKLSYHRFTKR